MDTGGDRWKSKLCELVWLVAVHNPADRGDESEAKAGFENKR
jgi:hypothetical protein